MIDPKRADLAAKIKRPPLDSLRLPFEGLEMYGCFGTIFLAIAFGCGVAAAMEAGRMANDMWLLTSAAGILAGLLGGRVTGTLAERRRWYEAAGFEPPAEPPSKSAT